LPHRDSRTAETAPVEIPSVEVPSVETVFGEAPSVGARELSVRRAARADAGALVDVLAAAFLDDPLMRWAFPDSGRRREIVPRFFHVFVDLAVAAGGAFLTGERDAVLLALPPDTTPPAEFPARLREVAAEYADALLTIVRLQDEYHPRHLGPHFSLIFLGVTPAHRGNGAADGLGRAVLAECDRLGVAAYAETSSPGGEAAARRHGFAPLGRDIRIPGGPSLRPLWRPATSR
jgi:GNAT superfamily N-acetyltransferase